MKTKLSFFIILIFVITDVCFPQTLTQPLGTYYASHTSSFLTTTTQHYIGSGSWTNDQSKSKSEFYYTAPELGNFTVGDIAYITYYTKKTTGITDGSNPPNFSLYIYTKLQASGNDANWYHRRLTAEPYFSKDLNAPGDQWNKWSTSSGVNQLTFYDYSRIHNYGFYGQPTLSEIQSGINWSTYNSSYDNTTQNYSSEEVLYISFQTGSAWNSSFKGYIDDITIALKNGKRITLDLEAQNANQVYVNSLYTTPEAAAADGYVLNYNAFNTISSGIAGVAVGGTVNVAAGTYNERLNIGKSLDLRGAQYDVNPTTIGTRTNSAAESIIDITGLGVVNPNVAVDIPLGITNVSLNGFTIIGSPTFNYADEAVIRTFDKGINISDNIINGYYGILFKGGSNLIANNNKIIINKVGITIQPGPADHVTLDGNFIIPGSTPASDAAGIYMTGVNTATVNNNVIEGFNNSNGCGGSSNTNVSFNGNTFQGNNKGISFWGNTTDINIKDNYILNSLSNGIEIKGQNIFILNNHINGNSKGILVDKNTIATQNVNIHNNDLSSNVSFALMVTDLVDSAEVNATCNWWGSASGPGVNSISGDFNFTPWLISADGQCVGGTPLGNIMEILTEINAIYPTGNKKTDDKLEEVIKHLTNALDSDLWSTDGYLQTKEGDKVFNEIKDAVNKLNDLIKDKNNTVPVGTLQNFIDELVANAKALAQEAITEAIQLGGNSNEIDKANDEIANGDAEAAKGKYNDAIENYRNAWEHAQQASNKLAKSGAEEENQTAQSHLPANFNLNQNYPNPFNPTTIIRFALPSSEFVSLKVYDILGNLVATLENSFMPAGYYNVSWNASKFSSGLYIYRLSAGNFSSTKKMILIK